MEKNREYTIKLGTTRVTAVLEEIHKVIDASTLNYSAKEAIEKHDVGECVLKVKKPIAFDIAEEIASLGRFVIIDNFEISGGGIIRENLPDNQSWVRNMVQQRNYQWVKSKITCGERAERYNQKAVLLLITGKSADELNDYGKSLEKSFFDNGKIVYYLGFESVVGGLDADIRENDMTAESRREHLRRLGEIIHILLDSGLIVIATVEGLKKDEIGLLEAMVNPDFIEVLAFAEKEKPEFDTDLIIHPEDEFENTYHRIKQILKNRGIIYSPW